MIELALTKIGVTQDRVKHWLGGECGCEERKEKLNALSSWARRVVLGKTDQAEEYLNRIISPDD